MGEVAETAARSTDGPGGKLWDDWDIPPRVARMPELHLEGYDGPLDVLLELAERQRIDLGRISVVALAEQFVAAMERLALHVPIERRAEWLVLAARLVLLRARLMFPASPAAAAAADRDAAVEVERLEQLRFLRAAASWLQARPRLGQDVFAPARRGPDPRASSYMALMEACLTVLRGREGDLAVPEPVYAPNVPELFRIQGALIRLRARLAELAEAAPLEAFLPRMPARVRDRDLIARSAVGSTFLAALELTRTGECFVWQAEDFGAIELAPSSGA